MSCILWRIIHSWHVEYNMCARRYVYPYSLTRSSWVLYIAHELNCVFTRHAVACPGNNARPQNTVVVLPCTLQVAHTHTKLITYSPYIRSSTHSQDMCTGWLSLPCFSLFVCTGGCHPVVFGDTDLSQSAFLASLLSFTPLVCWSTLHVQCANHSHMDMGWLVILCVDASWMLAR